MPSLPDLVERFVLPSDDPGSLDAGVEGNSRLTGALGAVLFVGLFLEGCTLVLGVGDTLVAHVFVGFLIVPPILVKIGSTGYRMARYYLKDDRYRRKGPPHPVLRVLGPLVVLSTVALMATGIALIAGGRGTGWNLGELHRDSFLVWIVLMTVHVLGHLVETARLSAADWLPRRARVDRIGVRRGLVIGSLVVGLGLGALSIGWTHTFQSGRGAERHELREDGH